MDPVHDTGRYRDSGLQELVVKVHSLRMHPYTDNIMEYRLEVAPAQLVCLAGVGIQGLRGPADTTYDVMPSYSQDDSGGDPDIGAMDSGRKKRCAGRSPEPESHLRMWMPACMVRPALPDLVEQYKAELEAKYMKKSKRKQQEQAPTTKAQMSPSWWLSLPPPVEPKLMLGTMSCGGGGGLRGRKSSEVGFRSF
jgi:holliday junction resolvase YEN1